MRKRLMNISKRCMVAIMSAAFVMSSVTVSMAIPVGVYALDNNEDDNVYIDSAIDKNTGIGVNVRDTGSVQTNRGEIIHNYGTVVNNTGVIENNFGTVTNNYGTIESNISGNIMNQYDGTVINESGTITNYFGGDISDPISPLVPTYVTNNFADITNNTPAAAVDAPNQFRSVTISNNNITAEYGEGFNEKTVDKEGNKKQFIQVKRNRQDLVNDASGLITISPKENYKITGRDTEEVTQSSDSTFYYELREDGGKYYLTIINPTQALTIDPTTLGLVISRIQKEENVVISQVAVNTSDNTDDSSNDGDQSDSTSNVSASENATDRILKGMNSNSKQNVFELDYTKQSNLTWEDFEKLCKTRSDVQKNCSFICDGKLYVLQIPAIDTASDKFKTCLENFKADPYKGVAGPAAIASIFSSLNVTCKLIEPQTAVNSPSSITAIAAASDWSAATVRLVPENGAYTVTLTSRVPNMTFLRQSLEKFAKYNDRLVIDTPYGTCEISLAELLSFNEKAGNFRFVVTGTAIEIYVNGELFRSVLISDLT